LGFYGAGVVCQLSDITQMVLGVVVFVAGYCLSEWEVLADEAIGAVAFFAAFCAAPDELFCAGC
jgi:hypothetical protein